MDDEREIRQGNRLGGSSTKVAIPDSTSVHLTTGMTLEAWVNSTATGGWRDAVYTGDDNYYLESSPTVNAVAPGGGAIVNNGYTEAYGSGAPTLNTWSHLAVTFDGSTIRFYLKGTLVSSRSRSGTIRTSTNPLQIGGDSLYGQYFKGVIDDVRV